MSHSAHFFISYPFLCLFFIYGETPIFNEGGIIEVVSITILIVCLLRCAQYSLQSRIKQGHYFWLASVLVFLTVIRRELNYLPELFIASDFMLLSQPYGWWEDMVLLGIHIITLGFLIYSWRYFWAVLKQTPIWLYLIVAALALLQYMGENAIVFPEDLGVMIEELTEAIVYAIALIYLWRFKLTSFDAQSTAKLGFKLATHSNQ